MFEGINVRELTDTLSAVEPVELKGVALLKRRRPRAGEWYPAGVSPREMAAAAGELMAYMDHCRSLRERLTSLPPVASSAAIEEWPL